MQLIWKSLFDGLPGIDSTVLVRFMHCDDPDLTFLSEATFLSEEDADNYSFINYITLEDNEVDIVKLLNNKGFFIFEWAEFE